MRDQWEFQYKVSEVKAAISKKRDYHEDRQEHWETSRDKAEAELRATGMEFREHCYTGGKTVEAVIDPERATYLQKCLHNVTRHEMESKKYSRWFRAFDSKNLDEVVTLVIGDIEYFDL